ncbi:DUF4175 domain-containing protein [Hymenobacter lutimineralis]|uniref:DUF4175 domain-containing protein n=1 Tax=Hymenobacter lutimineralis TaxID=2606448 RepID=A0A5D6V2N3_9BACT|nr:DUF4175 family protein [Hymenobacter lutimineralis]TYZ09252.1 DUF4175 domain-containing protein [Hymenobacter lutimineralis]
MTTTSRSLATAEVPYALLQRAWRRQVGRQLFASLLPVAAGASALLVALQQAAPAWAVWATLGVAGLLMAVYCWRLAYRPLSFFAGQLDRQYPALEDSSGLLLRPAEDLQLLEKLQLGRTCAALLELLAQRGPLLPIAWRGTLLLMLALLVAAVGVDFWSEGRAVAPAMSRTSPLEFPVSTNPGPPAASIIAETRVFIQPPAYTHRAAFTAAEPSFRCPAGSRVRWTVAVAGPRSSAPVLEVGRQQLAFRAVEGQPVTYQAELLVTKSVLYRVRYAGQTSNDYAIEAIPDHAPSLQLRTPRPYTLVEFGTPPRIPVRVAVHDDYGLTKASLVATVAQGQGEGVKFRQVTQDLTTQLAGQPTQATLAHVLNLPKLGLTYGDEVYFQIRVWDNHQQMTRSDSYLVQWEDTTVDDSNLDVSLGVTTVPAYFRSQRQIIIDTEKLLAEKAALSAEQFVSRGNDIGHDQKILRLRYGKFMGEEFSEAIGEVPTEAAGAEHHDEEPGAEYHDHAHAPPSGAATSAANTPETAALMEAYVHSHDDAETADFLEPAVKAKLSIVLSQMWEAELRLRTGRAKEALPFEYKALRLLKQVQQQTRAYVRKSGFEPPPLPEATLRLSGDLAGAAPVTRQSTQPAPARQPALRAALRAVAELRQGRAPARTDAAVLELGGQVLTQAAQSQPGAYLSALRSLRRLTAGLKAGKALPASDLSVVERAFTRLLPAPPAAPARPAGTSRLAQRYLQELR